MSEILINYDELVQNALRSVVKAVLSDVEKDGLPGEHHFYIAFKTQAEGVEISPHLKSRYPDEMTIVVQHKFWGLKVDDDQFEIGLSFNQKPELLVIPYAAIAGFVDPSVQFALQFNDDEDGDEESDDDLLDNVEPAAEPALENIMDDGLAESPVADNSVNDGSNVVTLDAFRKKS